MKAEFAEGSAQAAIPAMFMDAEGQDHWVALQRGTLHLAGNGMSGRFLTFANCNAAWEWCVSPAPNHHHSWVLPRMAAFPVRVVHRPGRDLTLCDYVRRSLARMYQIPPRGGMDMQAGDDLAGVPLIAFLGGL